MPLLGFGTHPMRGDQATEAVLTALSVGYRLVDTATRYRNEAAVGAALAETDLPRSELFVTTKMPPDQVGRERLTLERSLTALGCDYVDLWLIHWPRAGTGRHQLARVRARPDEGLVRAIGVSNYSVDLIDELRRETGVCPAVNQVRWGRATTTRVRRGAAPPRRAAQRAQPAARHRPRPPRAHGRRGPARLLGAGRRPRVEPAPQGRGDREVRAPRTDGAQSGRRRYPAVRGRRRGDRRSLGRRGGALAAPARIPRPTRRRVGRGMRVPLGISPAAGAAAGFRSAHPCSTASRGVHRYLLCRHVNSLFAFFGRTRGTTL
ncbi:aldo/keto reductase [Streptomyces sp. M19]